MAILTYADSLILFSLVLLLCLDNACLAQEGVTAQPTVTVRSTVVMVPVFVTTRKAQPVFDLVADDFRLTDNGVQQTLTLEQDTDSEPLALAVVVETGGAGVNHLSDYQGLEPILGALFGDVEHEVTVVGFDSTPHLIVPFTQKKQKMFHTLLQPFLVATMMQPS